MLDVDAARNEAITRLVQQQYERFPYPDLDPDEDPRGWTMTSILDEMCDHLWAGRKRHNELTILDAGCGTGSPVCQCKLRAPGARVVAIDLSSTSLDRARKRAKRLGCEVEFHQMPLQRVGELGLTFDYIVSSGVLHHLPDPLEGLCALRSVLAPGGVMSIMLYGTWGRVSVYALQAALRLACDPEGSIDDHIRLARTLAFSAPPWYPIHRPSFGFELRPGNDGGVVDLLLHVQDVHYDVPRVYQWLRDARMWLHSWLMPYHYVPEVHVADPELRRVLGRMPEEERQAVAELYDGAQNKQTFFAVRDDFAPLQVAIEGGAWRKLGCRLSGFLEWSSGKRIPGSEDYSVTMSSGELTCPPLRVSPWQSVLVQHILKSAGRVALGELVDRPEVRRAMGGQTREHRDRMVEEFLREALMRRGIALIEEKELHT